MLTPSRNVSWTVNYYLGQEHPDATPVSTCGPAPVQPGLCFEKISPAPDGKLHIFDSYVSWQTTPKLLLQLEGDYVIETLWGLRCARSFVCALAYVGRRRVCQVSIDTADLHRWTRRVSLRPRRTL